jgi:hypothetical protein
MVCMSLQDLLTISITNGEMGIRGPYFGTTPITIHPVLVGRLRVMGACLFLRKLILIG